jgi:hypothetical protein
MPNTRQPKNPVPVDYQPPNTEVYPVETGDSLKSIAEANGLTWQELAKLNWKTSVPEEINWYLYRNVGCRTESPDGHNYSFRSDDDPGIIYVPSRGGPRPGGGTPGGPGGPVEPPKPGHSDVPGSEPGRVARDVVNILKLPVTRLPVGWRVSQPAPLTRFRIWVPTNTGGTLTVRHLGSGQVDLRKPAKKVLKPAAKEVVYQVKTGEFGEFFVLADGALNEVVECTFVQISFSRDGEGDSDPPLAPWTFYYWPTALKIKQSDGSEKTNTWSDQAADVMDRYGQAFSLDGAACRLAEKTDHGTPSVGAGWEGHCHNSAPASILFEQPTAITYKGISFDEEEMEYLAAEFFGNFGTFESGWQLKRGSSKPGGATARWYLPGYFKPGGPKTRDAFVWGLKKEGYNAASGANSADVIADAYISSFGSEAAFSTQIEQWMGELAAEFYDNLIQFMRVKKHPLLSNMRSYGGGNGPEEVWNQGYFWYQAWYQENGDTKDEKDMIILFDLRANLDKYPSTGLPAEIIGNDMKPKDSDSLIFNMEWRIQFDASGKIVVVDKKNEWRHLKNSSADELYAPSNMLTLAKPVSTRKTGDAFSLGNKFVGSDLVSNGLLTVHKRYT